MEPKVLVFASTYELYEYLTNEIASQLKKKPSSRLGLSTGKTMIPFYNHLKCANLDFSKVKTFNQDEYLHPKKGYRESWEKYMTEKFLNHTNMKKENFHILPFRTSDPREACADYEKEITKKPLDLQILGLGRNGHIGFNEPGSSFSSKTRVINLTKSTQKANHTETKQAMTIGLATTMHARLLILVATGKHKARAVHDLLKNPISTKCPASIIRKHPDALVLLDKPAASLL